MNDREMLVKLLDDAKFQAAMNCDERCGCGVKPTCTFMEVITEATTYLEETK